MRQVSVASESWEAPPTQQRDLVSYPVAAVVVAAIPPRGVSLQRAPSRREWVAKRVVVVVVRVVRPVAVAVATTADRAAAVSVARGGSAAVAAVGKVAPVGGRCRNRLGQQ